MFSVDEPTAEAVRRAYDEGGELAGVAEFKRHFPLISDNAKDGEWCGSSPVGSRRRPRGSGNPDRRTACAYRCPSPFRLDRTRSQWRTPSR